jgi:hypothetical protein
MNDDSDNEHGQMGARNMRVANLAALKADIAQGVADMASSQFGEVNVDDLKIRGTALLATGWRVDCCIALTD